MFISGTDFGRQYATFNHCFTDIVSVGGMFSVNQKSASFRFGVCKTIADVKKLCAKLGYSKPRIMGMAAVLLSSSQLGGLLSTQHGALHLGVFKLHAKLSNTRHAPLGRGNMSNETIKDRPYTLKIARKGTPLSLNRPGRSSLPPRTFRTVWTVLGSAKLMPPEKRRRWSGCLCGLAVPVALLFLWPCWPCGCSYGLS